MALTLDLLRHGIAAPADGRGDFHRPLTEEGRAALRRLAERLAAEPQRPAVLYASPLARARETAAVIAAGLGLERAVVELEELGGEAEPDEVLEALSRALSGERHVMLVGHQPQMGRIALHLTGRHAAFSPGTLVRIETEGALGAGSGRILATFPPRG